MVYRYWMGLKMRYPFIIWLTIKVMTVCRPNLCILLMNRRVYLEQSGTTRRSGHFRIGPDCSQFTNLQVGNGLFIYLNEEVH